MDQEEMHEFGDFEITNDAIETIIARSAHQVDGVYDLSGNYLENIYGKVIKSRKNRGIKAEIVDSMINIELSIIVKYGFVLEEVARNVQQRINDVIKEMLGLEIGNISVEIKDVYIQKKE